MKGIFKALLKAHGSRNEMPFVHINDVETATDVNAGLSSREVRERLTGYGYNEVPEKKANPALLFARKFWGITMANKNRFGCDEVVVGYESTGPYAEPDSFPARLVQDDAVSDLRRLAERIVELAGQSTDKQGLSPRRLARDGIMKHSSIFTRDMGLLRALDAMPYPYNIYNLY
jgi:hypothetical protein